MTFLTLIWIAFYWGALIVLCIVAFIGGIIAVLYGLVVLVSLIYGAYKGVQFARKQRHDRGA